MVILIITPNYIILSQICEHKWKLFDISNGKWSTYHEANNKIIDEAFWAGETSVRIQFNRKKYTIQFGTMMQVNSYMFLRQIQTFKIRLIHNYWIFL